MRHALRKMWFAPLLLLGLAACDSPFDYDEQIEGYYSYAGTVDGYPGYSVNGELRITRASGSRAEATLDWYMYEGSRRVLEITAYDVPVYISGSTIRFETWGDLQLSSGWTEFELRHEGRFSSNRTIRGDWDLITDYSDDSGNFTASR